MSQRITIEIKNKIARCLTELPIVCGNSDYIADFLFDEEWNDHSIKTARFKINGEYIDVVFTGNECEIPIISDAKMVWMGVFAGELATTTPALVYCRPSILDGEDVPAPPREDVYSQIMTICEEAIDASEDAEERVAELLQHLKDNPPRDGISPTVEVTDIDGGHKVSITDVNGEESFVLTDGVDGVDGVSPTIETESIENGHRVTLTDANGTRSIELFNGEKGEQGERGLQGEKGAKGDKGDRGDTGPQGAQGIQGIRGLQGIKGEKGDKGDRGYAGSNGISPIITTTSIENGHKITFTDAKGTHVISLMNGAKGDTGADGYTPIRGTDYWTDTDKAEVKGYVDDLVGDISSALDELHTYAQNIVNGGNS